MSRGGFEGSAWLGPFGRLGSIDRHCDLRIARCFNCTMTRVAAGDILPTTYLGTIRVGLMWGHHGTRQFR